MKTFIAAFVLGIISLIGVAIPAPHGPAPVVAVSDDEAGWDCATQGNKVCGPQPTDTYLEVYEDGSLEHWIDWNGNQENDQSWPAGTVEPTGQVETCRKGDTMPLCLAAFLATAP